MERDWNLLEHAKKPIWRVLVQHKRKGKWIELPPPPPLLILVHSAPPNEKVCNFLREKLRGGLWDKVLILEPQTTIRPMMSIEGARHQSFVNYIEARTILRTGRTSLDLLPLPCRFRAVRLVTPCGIIAAEEFA